MAQAPQVGDLLGRYQLVEELGRGGMAVVFRARDPTLGREVAIKVMHPHLWGNAEYAARFTREAKAVAALRHQNIVEIYDFGEETAGELPGYIVSELVKGSTLREFLDLRGHPLPEVAVMVALKLAEALGCAHDRGIIHRDLKPENVIIAEGGRVVLTDFGIARITEGEAVTQTGAMVGSPAYMSPEQARGHRVDPRSDLFSLGVVLYLLCTGKLPFSGQDPISTALAIVECKYEPPLKHNPTIGGRIDRVISRLLQREPDRRFAGADEAIASLVEVLNDAGVDDVDAALKSYFDDPGGFNESLTSQVIERSLTLAQEASESGDLPRALSLCDRVLAFEPGNTDALELMTQLSARGGWRKIAAFIGLLLLLGGLSAGAVYYFAGYPGGVGGGSDGGLAMHPGPAPDGVGVVPVPVTDAPVDASAFMPDRPSVRDAQVRPRPPRPHKIRRRRDASPAKAVTAPKDMQVVARPDTRSLPTHGEILVALGPYCDLFLNGKKIGTSPMEKPLRVKPGKHVVLCRNGPNGAWTQRTVTIKAGERKRIAGPIVATISVHLGLKRSDAVRIDGKVYRGTFTIEPKPHRVDLIKGGRVLKGKGAWVTFPSRSCTLVDQPTLRCR